jgi:glucose 1-dehydrogenase
MSATSTPTAIPKHNPDDPTDLDASRKFAVPNRLAGKVAIVTGASSGIGQSIAVRMAAEGAQVVIDYVGHIEGANETLGAIKNSAGRAIVVQADITQCADITKLGDETYSQLGRCDILVNNAGVEKGSDFWNVTEADYDAVLHVNLKGTFFLTQACVKRLIDAKRPGRIINISSVHEDMVFPHFSTYAASKGALRMLMRNLAVELGPHNITCNDVAPGAIITPINKKLLENKQELQALLNNIPLGRMGTPAEVAGLVAYLSSEEAGYITGSTFIIDGGLIRNYHEQ